MKLTYNEFHEFVCSECGHVMNPKEYECRGCGRNRLGKDKTEREVGEYLEKLFSVIETDNRVRIKKGIEHIEVNFPELSDSLVVRYVENYIWDMI